MNSTVAILPGEHLHALRSRLRGELLLPGDTGWDDARRAWQLTADQRPAAVAIPVDVDDVVTLVAGARKLGLHLAPQSTGHAAGTIPTLDDTILLRTVLLDEVEIDPAAATARVGAGARWGRVAAAAAEHGLAAVGGMSPTVGVVGFLLGGGLGWFARSHGLGGDSIRAIDAVDAFGRRIRIDATHEPELFWAARRGVAPVVVTAIELRLHPVAELWAGSLMWPIEQTPAIVRAWRSWAGDLPDAVTSLVRVLRFPPLPEVPEPLRGQRLVAIEAAIQADAAGAEALLSPLRALAPVADSVRPMSPAELGAVHGDPPQPTPSHGRSVVLAELSEEAVESFAAAALAPDADALLSIELRELGGALAASGIRDEALVFAVGIVPVPEAAPAVAAAADGVIERLRPYAGELASKNFTETPGAPAAIYGADLDRLRRTVAAWDPEGVIRAGHPVG